MSNKPDIDTKFTWKWIGIAMIASAVWLIVANFIVQKKNPQLEQVYAVSSIIAFIFAGLFLVIVKIAHDRSSKK